MASPVAGSIICAYPVTLPGGVRDARHRLDGGQDAFWDRVAFIAAAASGSELTRRERHFRADDDVAPGRRPA